MTHQNRFTMDAKVENNLARFKRVRDAMIAADAAELEHTLKQFVRELERNDLVALTLPSDEDFDVEAWWNRQRWEGHPSWRRLSSLDLPDEEDHQMLALLDLARSMASGDREQLDIRGFGQVLGKTKMEDAAALTISIVLRPLAEIISDRVRKQVQLANPAIRELAGVPLDRIPGDDETRIFLSHKTLDKALVRPYYELLKELGLSPWLDEHDMRPGDVPHRGITEGFDHACAVVFFITENFKDERWLAREIDQAVHRKIDQGKRFSVITLVFEGASDVPRPLQDYIYHPVTNQVEAVRQILRGLPIEVGPARWRA